MNRVVHPPPHIEGFEHKRLIGHGGFADVYLYLDVSLQREVAIKVLRNTLDDAETREAFEAESKQMARVPGHPYIVDIYSIGVAADGRPYLITQFYPRPAYSQRIRTSPLSVAEGIKRGIEISSAVDALHGAGIIHRDIKPANLLTDEYNRPGLTDFGISGSHADDSLGYSPPYAAPEVIADTSPGDRRSDVYSLAATLYALLVGRSPFEVDSGDNTRSAVTERVLNHPPARIGRRDVPEMLERLIAQCLSREPDKRPQTAHALARSLQQIQRHLQHEVTEFITTTPAVGAPAVEIPGFDDDSEKTKYGGVKVVDPEAVSEKRERSASAPLIHDIPTGSGVAAPEPTPFEVESVPTPVEEATVRGQGDTHQTVEPTPSAEVRKTPRWQIVAGVAAVGAIVVVASIVLITGGGAPENPAPATSTGSGLVIVDVPDAPEGVEIAIEGSAAQVTWESPGAEPGDEYQVTYRFGLGGEPEILFADTASVGIPDVPETADLCVEVLAVRSGRFSESTPIMCEGSQ